MINLKDMNFGEFIEFKRNEARISLRAAARSLDISPQFFSEVEKSRRSAFTPDKLELLANILKLNEDETYTMYDKAAETRRSSDIAIPQDIPDYIMERDYVLSALRLAKEVNAGEDEWRLLVEELKKRRG